MLSSNQISFLGLGRFTDFEARVIADRELPVVDMRQLAADPRGSAQLSLSPLAECDGLAIHFDVDLVDFLDAPLAENTDRGQAPSLTACGDALGELLSDARVRALTVTEFNPHHGSPNGSTTKRLIDVIATAIGRGD
jgi:arginase